MSATLSIPPLLTFPARPVNGGHLKYALPKVGEWSYEPKYNGWRAIVHTPTGAMWNRHGQRLSIQREFSPALAALARCDCEWLDVEALERRHKMAMGTLIVLDCLTDGDYAYRAVCRHECIVKAGLGECLTDRPECDRVYVPPIYPEDQRDHAWAGLQEINQRWGCDFYEGLVAKRNDSLYPLQLHSPDQTTAGWMKHRFIK